MSKKTKFPELKHEIKAREAASREIRQRIHQTSHQERWEAWRDKRREGSTTRCLLLLYAMLRGVPRWVVEAKHHPSDHWWIHMGMNHMAGQRGFELTKDAIEQWLRVEAPKATEVAA
jgi:hypothetical protein